MTFEDEFDVILCLMSLSTVFELEEAVERDVTAR